MRRKTVTRARAALGGSLAFSGLAVANKLEDIKKAAVARVNFLRCIGFLPDEKTHCRQARPHIQPMLFSLFMRKPFPHKQLPKAS